MALYTIAMVILNLSHIVYFENDVLFDDRQEVHRFSAREIFSFV